MAFLSFNTVLVEVQRKQCFSIPAVEIAAVILDRLIVKHPERCIRQCDARPSTALSTNGFISVVFTLLYVSWYQRLIQLIRSLSIITVLLFGIIGLTHSVLDSQQAVTYIF